MNAQELFEKLGYKLIEKRYGGACLVYENKLAEVCICFHTNKDKGNRLHIYSLGNTYQDSGMITFAEIKAINKQIEELSWEDDTEEQMRWFNKENKDE